MGAWQNGQQAGRSLCQVTQVGTVMFSDRLSGYDQTAVICLKRGLADR